MLARRKSRSTISRGYAGAGGLSEALGLSAICLSPYCLNEALFETELIDGLEQRASVSIYAHRARVVEFLFSESTAQQSY
jgi:hypothetical protein